MTERQSAKIANMGFVCALLVVFIHLGRVPQDVGSFAWTLWFFVREILASVAVPFFFLVSGFFLAAHFGEPHWWRRALGKRLRTLGIPYLIWCAVPFVLFSLIWTTVRPDGECMRAAMKFSSIAAAFGLNLFTSPEANRPLWYVRGLMIFMVLSPLLAWLVRRSRGWALVAFGAFLLATNPGTLDVPDFWLSQRARIFWTFGLSSEGLFYFTLGIFLRAHPLKITPVAQGMFGLIGLCLGFGALFACRAGWPWWGYLVTLSIPLTMGLVWVLIPSRRFANLLTGSAFALYVMHAIVIKVVDEIGIIPSGEYAVFAAWLAVLGVALTAALLMRRFLPSVSALAFGGR